MLELAKELHKKEYCNNEAIKLDFEVIKELIPFNIVLKQGFYEVFECKVCGLGMMTELPDCRLKYSCNNCYNVETLEERKAFYYFNCNIIKDNIKQSIKNLSTEIKDLKDTNIENIGFVLAFNNILKFELCFFDYEKDFHTFKQDEENCIVFLPFCKKEINLEDNVFLIDIYEFLEFNILLNKIEINEMKLKYIIFNILAKITLNISKTSKEFVKKAANFWLLYVTNNNTKLARYNLRRGGRELFLKDIKIEIPYLADDFAENLWKEKIKPKLEEL